MKILTAISSFALFALSSTAALAGPVTGPVPGTIPEPGSFALLAIGAGAAAIVWARGRNKK